MLKVRVIPTLLYKSVGLVKGVGFNSWRRVDTVLPAIKVYNMREVDELILVDIEATKEGRDPDYESIRDFSRECFVPFCVGGGICIAPTDPAAHRAARISCDQQLRRMTIWN